MNKNLDFLRAFAVLLVVAGHLLAFFGVLAPVGFIHVYSLGKLGVVIFFVHTTLVLMQSLEREPDGTAFLIRRVFRIYPLAILVVGLIAAFRIPQSIVAAFHFTGGHFEWRDIVANLLLVQEFVRRVPLLGPTWSLSYEMEMYLILPFLFYLARNTTRAIAIYISGLVCAYILHYTVWAQNYPAISVFAYYLPCFIPGIIAYRLLKLRQKKLPAYCWPIFVLAASLLYTIGISGTVYAICAALGFGISRFHQITWKPLVKACHYVAKYSYGIYMTHFFCIYFAFEFSARLPIPVRILTFVVLLLALPIALYHSVEDPMIQFGKRVAAHFSTADRRTPVPASLAPAP